jgi:hypothetical protein
MLIYQWYSIDQDKLFQKEENIFEGSERNRDLKNNFAKNNFVESFKLSFISKINKFENMFNLKKLKKVDLNINVGFLVYKSFNDKKNKLNDFQINYNLDLKIAESSFRVCLGSDITNERMLTFGLSFIEFVQFGNGTQFFQSSMSNEIFNELLNNIIKHLAISLKGDILNLLTTKNINFGLNLNTKNNYLLCFKNIVEKEYHLLFLSKIESFLIYLLIELP